MRLDLSHASPQCSHITRKRGIYHYRRRWPGRARGEVLLSLATRHYREAEHRAGLVDAAFRSAWERAVSEADVNKVDLGPILRGYLREALDRDLQSRLDRPPGAPVYAHWWEPGDPGTATEADLQAIYNARTSLAADLAANRVDDAVEEAAASLLRQHGLPGDTLQALAAGLIEAAIRKWEVAERRTLGTEPLVFSDAALPPPSSPPAPLPATPKAPARPLASSFVDAFFTRRQDVDRATHGVMGQDRGTLRRFLEACGDRAMDTYTRADITGFLDTLRKLPNTYGKSPKDKGRSIAEIIAEADAKGAERLADKTVKRHLSALAQFFRFAVDAGQLTNAARVELVDNHRFREERAAKDQRDAWTEAELTKLFTSPVWAGCQSASRRSTPGTAIIRDARFWLPLLALYHGARLEEFADLYRRDMGCEAGTWFLRITETEERRLKTDNAERVLPLHPELARMGFLEYVQSTAPNPDDPLFPDLEPQGWDRKRGPRITRWFGTYRKAVGVYREAVAMHAFRHNANTRLRDTIKDWQQERHVNYLLGHSQGGGEGRERYDKGPGLKAAADTLALLSYPELNLSGLYTAFGVGQ